MKKIEELVPLYRLFYGSMLGAMLIVMFGIIFSHEIFFSNRWDSNYQPRYQEMWMLLMTIGVLIPYFIGRYNTKWLIGFIQLGALFQMIVLSIWIANLWPIFTPEYVYTSIGYVFVDNILLYQLYLISTVVLLAAMFLFYLFSPREEKYDVIRQIVVLIFATLLLAGVFLITLNYYSLIGWYIVAGIMLVVTGCFFVLEIIGRFKLKPTEPFSKELQTPIPLKKSEKLRNFFEIGLIFLLIAVAFIFLQPKEWETIVIVLGFLLPIIEFMIRSSTSIIHKIKHQELLPQGYGHVMRFFLACFSIIFILLAALIVANYYRYLMTTLIGLIFPIVIGYGISHLMAFRFVLRKYSFALILNVIFLIAICISLGSILIIYSQWADFYSVLLVTPTLTPQDVPLFGLYGTIPCGLGLGGLLYCAVRSIGEYHQETALSQSGDPQWNGITTLWLIILIPFGFFLGEFYFGNRFFEWSYELIVKNHDNQLEVLRYISLVLGLIGLFAVAWILSRDMRFLIFMKDKLRLITTIPNDKKGSQPERTFELLPSVYVKTLGFVFILTLVQFLGSAFVVASPHNEPAYHELIGSTNQFQLWKTYPAEKVSPTYKPGNFISIKTQIDAEMVCGETERIHLILSNKMNYQHLRITNISLANEVSKVIFPAAGINWYYVLYQFEGQEEQLVSGNPWQFRGRENVSTEYITQIANWDGVKSTNQPIWISLTTYYNSTPGVYTGSIEFSWIVKGSSENQTLQIPLSVNVLDYQKPLKYRFPVFLGSSGVLGRTLWRYGRMGYQPSYADMNPPSFISSINWSMGTFVLNWTGFDAALDACARVGYTRMIYTWYPGDIKENTTEGEVSFLQYSQKWNYTVLNILGNASTHLTSKYFDLPDGQGQIRAIDMLMMDLYDEPGKDDAWRIIYYGQMLDQAAPEWKLMCTMGISRESATWANYTGPGGVYDVVDVRVQACFAMREYFEDPAVRELYAEYPAELWVYWINSPWPPYPNSAQAYNPGSAIYSQALQYYCLTNTSGYLFWTAGDNTWADGGPGYAGWGCGRYFYPVEDGSGSWDPGYRFELLDDSIEIAECLRHVDAILNGSVAGISAEQLSIAQQLRNSFDHLFPDFTTYPAPHEIGLLYTLKTDLIRFLATLP